MVLLEPRKDFDKCIIGVCYDEDRAIYDRELVIEVFMQINDWDIDEANDWFEYNRGSTLDESPPIFMSKEFDLDEQI